MPKHVNHLLDRDLCKQLFDQLISMFLFFWFSVTILSQTLIPPTSQLQSQQLMTSHTEYSVQTHNFCCAQWYTQTDKKSSLTDGFHTIK